MQSKDLKADLQQTTEKFITSFHQYRNTVLNKCLLNSEIIRLKEVIAITAFIKTFFAKSPEVVIFAIDRESLVKEYAYHDCLKKFWREFLCDPNAMKQFNFQKQYTLFAPKYRHPLDLLLGIYFYEKGIQTKDNLLVCKAMETYHSLPALFFFIKNQKVFMDKENYYSRLEKSISSISSPGCYFKIDYFTKAIAYLNLARSKSTSLDKTKAYCELAYDNLCYLEKADKCFNDCNNFFSILADQIKAIMPEVKNSDKFSIYQLVERLPEIANKYKSGISVTISPSEITTLRKV